MTIRGAQFSIAAWTRASGIDRAHDQALGVGAENRRLVVAREPQRPDRRRRVGVGHVERVVGAEQDAVGAGPSISDRSSSRVVGDGVEAKFSIDASGDSRA